MRIPPPSPCQNHRNSPYFSEALQPSAPVALRSCTVMAVALDADMNGVAWRGPYHVENEFDEGGQWHEPTGTKPQQISVSMP